MKNELGEKFEMYYAWIKLDTHVLLWTGGENVIVVH